MHQSVIILPDHFLASDHCCDKASATSCGELMCILVGLEDGSEREKFHTVHKMTIQSYFD